MAITKEGTKPSDQIAKLKEERAKIEAEAKAKLDAIAAKEAELQDSLIESLVAEAGELIGKFRDAGYSAFAAIKAIATGHGVILSDKESKAGRKASASSEGRKVTRPISADKPCGVCGYQTRPPHDARKHRSQPEKRPFTAEELTAMGLEKA